MELARKEGEGQVQGEEGGLVSQRAWESGGTWPESLYPSSLQVALPPKGPDRAARGCKTPLVHGPI